jgi:hypothetical protein
VNTGLISCVNNPFQSTVGNLITIDNVPANVAVGSGAAYRAAGASNASYVPTAHAIVPTSGYTIQFWYKPDSQTIFQYLFGDAAMLAPPAATFSGGAFRCFANGTGSVMSNLTVRGVPNQILSDPAGGTVLGPLATGGMGGGVNANGYVHLALVYNQTLNTGKWVINGTFSTTPIAQVSTPYNWTTTNPAVGLTTCGYNGTTSGAGSGRYDDYRIYNYARADADIAADYLMTATGNGPSGQPNQPCQYYEFEGNIQPHIMFIGATPFGAATNDPTGTGNHVVTQGSIIEWGSNSPNQPGTPASHLINVFGPTLGTPGIDGRPIQYRASPQPPINFLTPGVAGIQLGHGFSIPAYLAAILWSDGLSLGLLQGLAFLTVPGPYQYQVSPNNNFVIPPGFQDNDSIFFQGLAYDPAYPFTVATTNLASFFYKNPIPGPHAHVEARGPGAIQVTAFWEVWNTGDVDITQVTINAATATGGATGFIPTGALNTGGTLGAATSYRHNSEVFTALANLPPGFTAIGTAGTQPGGTAVTTSGLQFDFTNFSATIDHFHFDCAGLDGGAFPNNTNPQGSGYIGSTVTVTFANTTVLTGTLVADPSDPTAAVIDL